MTKERKMNDFTYVEKLLLIDIINIMLEENDANDEYLKLLEGIHSKLSKGEKDDQD